MVRLKFFFFLAYFDILKKSTIRIKILLFKVWPIDRQRAC